MSVIYHGITSKFLSVTNYPGALKPTVSPVTGTATAVRDAIVAEVNSAIQGIQPGECIQIVITASNTNEVT